MGFTPKNKSDNKKKTRVLCYYYIKKDNVEYRGIFTTKEKNDFMNESKLIRNQNMQAQTVPQNIPTQTVPQNIPTQTETQNIPTQTELATTEIEEAPIQTNSGELVLTTRPQEVESSPQTQFDDFRQNQHIEQQNHFQYSPDQLVDRFADISNQSKLSNDIPCLKGIMDYHLNLFLSKLNVNSVLELIQNKDSTRIGILIQYLPNFGNQDF
ncbi:hypothetical protein TVAG_035700 [Trichomonas vaginalis G3]|uniref:Uncharacterized protein n=1 Tax=Trichomonas vaginalis (strain ATCC PRA-98 / G3) TaxID=412133 RepID=A2DAP3_TRIV3|nr:hypothetical protein TVAGG3_0812010 [Trichomonas vaginalis G3]EAY22546.1 hypothetical protein TVAG_035700 [Trichomonas vaginalis G3]KAI5497279.1 hypothetical protein TVAGG3_0812010 [Trichomonas vaginalis G3]|eukprot:XP_001583532.1 hypothetical protein [Trichomonas vaginalis G3]